jgi:hypothetical protein
VDDSDAKVVTAEQEERDEDDEDIEATNERQMRMATALEETVLNSKGVDVMKFLIDPEDPVQTIENFFDFSFFVRDKKVRSMMVMLLIGTIAIDCSELSFCSVSVSSL